jgi:hypothetical protein
VSLRGGQATAEHLVGNTYLDTLCHHIAARVQAPLAPRRPGVRVAPFVPTPGRSWGVPDVFWGLPAVSPANLLPKSHSVLSLGRRLASVHRTTGRCSVANQRTDLRCRPATRVVEARHEISSGLCASAHTQGCSCGGRAPSPPEERRPTACEGNVRRGSPRATGQCPRLLEHTQGRHPQGSQAHCRRLCQCHGRQAVTPLEDTCRSSWRACTGSTD